MSAKERGGVETEFMRRSAVMDAETRASPTNGPGGQDDREWQK